MHYVMIKSTSNTESGYYFLYSEDNEIRDLLLKICMNVVESESDFKITDMDTLIREYEYSGDNLFETGLYYILDLIKLYEGDEVIPKFRFEIGSMKNRVECYTEDPKEFIEYLKTIDEDLIEGMDAIEAGKAIAKEYTSWL